MDKLKRYDLNCNIFDVYEYDGLSMQELLCQFYTKINECVDFSNSTLDLCGWLVNEGLKQEVAIKLTNWLNDGTLENLINETLFENLNKKIDDIKTVELANSITVLCTGGDDTELLQNALDNYSVISLEQGATFNLSKSIDTKGKTIITNNATLQFNNCDGLIVSPYTKTIGRLHVKGSGYYTQEFMSCVSNEKKNPYSEYSGVKIGSVDNKECNANHSSIDEITVRGFKYGIDIQRIWGLSINKIEVMHNEVGLYMKGISTNSPLADIDIKYIMCYSNGINMNISYFEYGTFGTIQCMEHRNIDNGDQSGIKFNNCKSLTINNIWLEFYNIPSDLSGVGSISGGINPSTIKDKIKYPLLFNSCQYINILNAYCHKARLMAYLYFTGNCIFQNVYHTNVADTITLGGKEYKGTFIQYSWGNESYKNTFINTNEPLIARNSGNAQYQGGYTLIKNDSFIVEDKGWRIDIQGDNIIRRIHDINGVMTSYKATVFTD